MKKNFLGVGYAFEDRIEEKLIWSKTVIVNDAGQTPTRKLGKGEVFNQTTGSNLISNIDFDFTERIYHVEYFGIMDLLSKIGGLSASINPIIGYFIPLLTLHFLYKLAGIIDEKLAELQREEMLNLIYTAKKQFK